MTNKNEQKKDRQQEIVEKLNNGLKEIFNSEKYKDFLRTSSKFTHYSLNNQILIYLQKPEATYVQTYQQWQSLERHVNGGEKAIQVIRPILGHKKCFKTLAELDAYRQKYPTGDKSVSDAKYEKAKKLLADKKVAYVNVGTDAWGFAPYSVFDVSQTSGREIITAKDFVASLTSDVPDYQNKLNTIVNYAESLGNHVSFNAPSDDEILQQGAKGYFRASENKIVICSGMSEAQTISTLFHELAHSILHGKDMKIEGIDTSARLERSIKELQAESVSYILCQQMGIESSSKSFGYIATWVSKDEEAGLKTFRENIDGVMKCAKSVSDKLMPVLTNEKEAVLPQPEEDIER